MQMPKTVSVKPYDLEVLHKNGYQLINDKEGLDQHPIRRIQKEGSDVLKVDELLGIALGHAGALDSKVKEYGAALLTSFKSVSDIRGTLDLDQLQASRLLAILELGKRLYSKSEGTLAHIRGIEDVYDHFRSMSHLAREQLRVALINSRYQLVHEETLAIGSTEYLEISARDVFQPAVERRVTAIILVHNHPSGESTPSDADKAFTKHMVQAGNLLGVEVLDHVVIGSKGYASCMAEEL